MSHEVTPPMGTPLLPHQAERRKRWGAPRNAPRSVLSHRTCGSFGRPITYWKAVRAPITDVLPPFHASGISRIPATPTGRFPWRSAEQAMDPRRRRPCDSPTAKGPVHDTVRSTVNEPTWRNSGPKKGAKFPA